jgi:hypothetical protein
MVEYGWFPLGTVVTTGAPRDLSSIGELSTVDVGMTAFAGRRCRLKIHAGKFQLRLRGFVTALAAYCAMRAQ